MDLTNFTKKDNSSKKSEVLIDNNDILIVKIGDNLEVTCKTEIGLEKYKKYLFMSEAESKVLNNEREAQDFFRESIDFGTEGLMLKSIDSQYTSGLRCGNMAKLKENNEPIDCVILAAEYGAGKRAGFYSSFYVAVLDDENQKFLTVGKVASGVKEIGEDGHSLSNLKNLLEPLKLSEKSGIVQFEPRIILEIEYQEIQKSTQYDSGYALRFPRILRLRDDKKLEEINTISDMDEFL